MRLLFCLFLISALVLGGCGGSAPDDGGGGYTGPRGSVQSRVCAFTPTVDYGYGLSGARVFVQAEGLTVETTCDASGSFLLDGIPSGMRAVEVKRGAFSTSFTVTVGTNQTNTLAATQYVNLDRTRIAIVTGLFDDAQGFLTGIGFRVKDSYDDSHFPTPQTIDATGSVDLIDGKNTDFYVSKFLGDLSWMRQYDIIYFSCGLQDLYFVGAPAAVIANLQAYVDGGRSIFVTDYASEVLRLAFPGHTDWFGTETTMHAARVGNVNDAQTVTVTDPGLAGALGFSSAVVNFNDPNWAVMEPVSTQQMLGCTVWAKATVSISGPATVTDAALLVSYPHGANGGRVFHSSFHNHSGATAAQNAVLKQVFFEL